MAERKIKIEKGKNLLTVMTKGQRSLVLRGSDGEVVFSAKDRSRHHTIVVKPGSYLLETDGSIEDLSIGRLDTGLREPTRMSGLKPPPAPRRQS